VSQNFTSLSSDLSTCTSFREPALIISGTNLYMLLQCGTTAFTPWFSTPSPLSNVGTWTWSYVAGSNTFGTRAQALTACSYTSSCGAGASLAFTEFDITPNDAGTAQELIATMASFPGGVRKSWGVVAMHMTGGIPPTLSPPALATSSGNVIVDATILSADSVATGPGSATYNAAGPFGIIIAHRNTSCPPPAVPFCSTQGGFFTGPLMESLLLP
jgi:hypothetical protein